MISGLVGLRALSQNLQIFKKNKKLFGRKKIYVFNFLRLKLIFLFERAKIEPKVRSSSD